MEGYVGKPRKDHFGPPSKTTSLLGCTFDVLLKELTTVKSPFYDSLCENWSQLFPDISAKPVEYSDGKLYLGVHSSSALFSLRPKLPVLRSALLKFPGAPKRLKVFGRII